MSAGWTGNYVQHALDYFKPKELTLPLAWWYMRLVRFSYPLLLLLLLFFFFFSTR
jgi:hypothetical protein